MGSTYTFFSYLSEFCQSSIWASTWLVNELLMTKLGWPVAQPRLTSRPSASRMSRLPSGKMMWSTWGLMFSQGSERTEAMSISESKWPMLQTMAWSGMASMWARVITRRLPVQVTKMLPTGAASSMVTTR